MAKYNVHAYAVIRIKVPGIEADNMKEAIEKSDKVTESILGNLYLIYGYETESAEEVTGYVVDPLDADNEIIYDCSVSFDANKEIETFK